MSFRPAAAGDIGAILPIMREYYAEDGYPFSEDDARRCLLALSTDASLGMLEVAVVDGGIAGYLAVTLGFSIEYRGRDAFIDELVIAARYRGRGLGRAAIEEAVRWCRGAGVRALHLEVERHRAPALSLYESSGFESHDRWLMTKAISAA